MQENTPFSGLFFLVARFEKNGIVTPVVSKRTDFSFSSH